MRLVILHLYLFIIFISMFLVSYDQVYAVELQDSIMLVDPNLTAPDGSPTPLAKVIRQRKEDTSWENTRDIVALETVDGCINIYPACVYLEPMLAVGGASKALVDSAIIVMSSTFGLAEAVAIQMGAGDDPSFKLDAKTDAQIADISSGYADRIRSAGSQVEFDALEAQMREVLADKEILQGVGKEINPYIEGFLEVISVIILFFLFLKLMDVIRRIQAWKREAEAKLAVERDDIAAKREEVRRS